MKSSALSILLLASWSAVASAESPRLVVHEWGTFTSFQDEDGRTIAGINVDDEPVPGFVHRIGGIEIFQTASRPARWSQGAPSCHPDVTLRLETPVLYFYPPRGWASAPFDVSASFNGGWLTEYYPAASAEGLNFPTALSADARGSLEWKQVRLDPGAAALMPDTTAPVWLAPRKVAATVVVSDANKEAEKYLFYRGVGHLDAPIVVKQKGRTLFISLREGEDKLTTLPRLWLVDVAEDGRVRHRTVNPMGRTVEAPAFTAIIAGNAASSLPALRRELADAIEEQGLYADEAAAMLETWRLSYFESPGLRVFFSLPAAWTEARLPLSISTPADVTRVMIGRVELVHYRQRAVLSALQRLGDETFPKLPLYYDDPQVIKLQHERGLAHSELYRETGRTVPEPLRLYESLGRFRDALLAHEWHSAGPSERARLEKVMASFSACVPGLRQPSVVVSPWPASAQ